MKEFFKTVLKRISDLIIKLISVKTIPAVLVSVIALQQPELGNTVIVGIMWSLVIGFRYAEKVAGLVKKG